MFSVSRQDREQELEQLTKELRQVNLQQFIQQTGTKVTVLPADPVEVEAPHVELERGAALGMLREGGKEGEGAGGAFTAAFTLTLALLREVNAPLVKTLAKHYESALLSASFHSKGLAGSK